MDLTSRALLRRRVRTSGWAPRGGPGCLEIESVIVIRIVWLIFGNCEHVVVISTNELVGYLSNYMETECG